MVRANPSNETPALDLLLHRYHILLDAAPRLFFSNLNLALAALRSGWIRKCNQVEVVDAITGCTHYSRGHLH